MHSSLNGEDLRGAFAHALVSLMPSSVPVVSELTSSSPFSPDHFCHPGDPHVRVFPTRFTSSNPPSGARANDGHSRHEVSRYLSVDRFCPHLSMAHFDGAFPLGFCGVSNVVLNGRTSEEWRSESGTYVVNPNCTGVVTNDVQPATPPLVFHFVVVKPVPESSETSF